MQTLPSIGASPRSLGASILLWCALLLACTGGGSSEDAQTPLDVVNASGSVLVFTKVSINNQGPFTFVVDTGASTSLVDPQLAARLSLPETKQVLQFAGFGGSGSGKVVNIREWRLGPRRVSSVTAVVASMPTFPPELLPTVDSDRPVGLLGSDVLSQLGTVTLDYAQRRLTFAGNAGADGRTVSLQVVKSPGGVAAFVKLSIHGEGPFYFIVDTGATRTTIDPQTATRLRLSTSRLSGVFVGAAGTGQARAVAFDRWQIDDVQLPVPHVAMVVPVADLPTDLLPGASKDRPVGSLGSDVFHELGAITIDYAKQRLVLRTSTPIRPEQASKGSRDLATAIRTYIERGKTPYKELTYRGECAALATPTGGYCTRIDKKADDTVEVAVGIPFSEFSIVVTFRRMNGVWEAVSERRAY